MQALDWVWCWKTPEIFEVHDTLRNNGEEKSQDLLAFHAFASCDQASSFAHCGKRTAWEALGAMDDVTEAFPALSNAPMVDIVDKVIMIPNLEW